MIRTYRMWLFLRIAERRFFNVTNNMHEKIAKDPSGGLIDKKNIEDMTVGEYLADFMKLNKRYTHRDALRAYMMAIKAGHLKFNDKDESLIAVTGSLFSASSIFGLIKEIAHTLTPVSSFVAVLIAIAAFIVSIWPK